MVRREWPLHEETGNRDGQIRERSRGDGPLLTSPPRAKLASVRAFYDEDGEES